MTDPAPVFRFKRVIFCLAKLVLLKPVAVLQSKFKSSTGTSENKRKNLHSVDKTTNKSGPKLLSPLKLYTCHQCCCRLLVSRACELKSTAGWAAFYTVSHNYRRNKRPGTNTQLSELTALQSRFLLIRASKFRLKNPSHKAFKQRNLTSVLLSETRNLLVECFLSGEAKRNERRERTRSGEPTTWFPRFPKLEYCRK